MQFAIGDRVLSRFGTSVGRVVRLEKLRGLVLVAWTRNITSWIDVDDLQVAGPTPSIAAKDDRAWFDRDEASKMSENGR